MPRGEPCSRCTSAIAAPFEWLLSRLRPFPVPTYNSRDGGVCGEKKSGSGPQECQGVEGLGGRPGSVAETGSCFRFSIYPNGVTLKRHCRDGHSERVLHGFTSPSTIGGRHDGCPDRGGQVYLPEARDEPSEGQGSGNAANGLLDICTVDLAATDAALRADPDSSLGDISPSDRDQLIECFAPGFGAFVVAGLPDLSGVHYTADGFTRSHGTDALAMESGGCAVAGTGQVFYADTTIDEIPVWVGVQEGENLLVGVLRIDETGVTHNYLTVDDGRGGSRWRRGTFPARTPGPGGPSSSPRSTTRPTISPIPKSPSTGSRPSLRTSHWAAANDRLSACDAVDRRLVAFQVAADLSQNAMHSSLRKGRFVAQW